MYAIFKRVISSQKELNISATLGTQMFAFMWIASAFSAAGWIVHFYLACVSRRIQKAEKSTQDTTVNQGSGVNEKKSGIRKRGGFLKRWENKTAGQVT